MAVAIQSNGSPGVSAAAGTISLTFNNVSGDRVVGFITGCENGTNRTVTGITYPDSGSVAMALIVSNPDTDVYVGLWEKTSAATGSNVMKATWSGGSPACNLSACSVTGSHASTASTAGTSVQVASDTTLAFTKTTTPGNGLVACFVLGDNNASITDTQVLLQNISNAHAGDNGAGAYQDATGGSDVITVSSTVSDRIRGVGMEIPAAAGGSDTLLGQGVM